LKILRTVSKELKMENSAKDNKGYTQIYNEKRVLCDSSPDLSEKRCNAFHFWVIFTIEMIILVK
jgi:hypothetical protein